MQWNLEDIRVVRKVADEMWDGAGADEKHILPGWDPDHLGEREVAVRTAAMAVLGSLDPDSGVRVPERALGALLRYIVDILEP